MMREELQDSPLPNRVFDVFRYLIQHPIEMLVWRWNWKAAVLSAVLRSPIFFTAYLAQKQGLWIALGAMLAQFLSRTLFGGINGAIIQSFSRVEPAWHAVLTIPLVLAVFSHLIEFLVQTAYDYANGINGQSKAIMVSVAISIVSAVFNLFAMRRGVLLVKDESQHSIWRDLWLMPWLALEFISFPLIWTWRKSKKKTEM